MKKNIFDRFQDNLAKQIELFEKREDKDVLKKIPFWMIIFFPYALYLFFFKTKVRKIFKVIVAIFFAFVLILFTDIAKNPNRVYNQVAKESYNAFVLDNTELELEECLYANKNNHFKINDDMYFSFTIYDKLNMYYGLFKIDNYNKDYKLVSLYDVDYNFNNIYSIGEFEKVKDIHPVILNFIMANNTSVSFDKISKITDVEESDLFTNIISQDVMIDNKSYHFEFNDFEVVNIRESGNEDSLYSLDLHSSLSRYLSDGTRDLLFKNFKSNYKLVGYNYLNNEHYYNLLVGDEFYCIKYYPGYNIDLMLVSDKEEFASHLESLMKK